MIAGGNYQQFGILEAHQSVHRREAREMAKVQVIIDALYHAKELRFHTKD